jgi:hypothetical protein
MKTLALGLATCALLAACSQTRSAEDSKTNWLRSCSAVADCGGELTCRCGVCTQPCDEALLCEHGDGAAVCADLRAGALANACGVAASTRDRGVCLQACSRFSACPDDLQCIAGTCVVPRNAEDAGSFTVDPLDAFVPVPDLDDAGKDAGKPDGALACGGGQRECCAADRGCPSGLICHIDDSCIEPGVADESGIASLWPLSPAELPVTAAGGFVYGMRALDLEGVVDNAIVRWPVNGGPGQLLTRGIWVSYQFSPLRVPVVADDHYVYVVASEALEEAKMLWRLPVDGHSPRESSGSAGWLLIQNDTHLYFTDAGNSRVFELAKSAFAASASRVEVFGVELGATDQITALALNATTLFVASTNDPEGPRPIYAIDIASRQRTVLAEPERFTGNFNKLHATDSELLVGNGVLERLDLTTLAVTRFDLTTPSGSQSMARWSALYGSRLLMSDQSRLDEFDLNGDEPINWVLNRGCDSPIAAADGMFSRVWTSVDDGEGNLVRFQR